MFLIHDRSTIHQHNGTTQENCKHTIVSGRQFSIEKILSYIPSGAYKVFVTVLFMREKMNPIVWTIETFNVTVQIGTVFATASNRVEQLTIWTSARYRVAHNANEKLVATSQAWQCGVIFHISADVVVARLVTEIVARHFIATIH